MFSGKVYKWNKYFMKQERQLVITNLNVYNFAKKSKFFVVNRRTAQALPH